MKIIVVNMRHETGDIRIDRRSLYGNPYRITRSCSRGMAVWKYRDWISQRPAVFDALLNEVKRLKWAGLTYVRLGCWCEPLECHGDVLRGMLEMALGENFDGGEITVETTPFQPDLPLEEKVLHGTVVG